MPFARWLGMSSFTDGARAFEPRRLAAIAAMERYAAGDAAAFGELYDLVARRLYAFLLRRTSDGELAADLLQQTLLLAHRARSRFIPGSDVLAWLIAIARRLVIDHARMTSRRRLLMIDVEVLGVATVTDRADELLQARQLARRISQALARLPEPQRVAFEVLKLHGLPLAEAARALRITVGALKLRMHRAHIALRAVAEETR